MYVHWYVYKCNYSPFINCIWEWGWWRLCLLLICRLHSDTYICVCWGKAWTYTTIGLLWTYLKGAYYFFIESFNDIYKHLTTTGMLIAQSWISTVTHFRSVPCSPCIFPKQLGSGLKSNTHAYCLFVSCNTTFKGNMSPQFKHVQVFSWEHQEKSQSLW